MNKVILSGNVGVDPKIRYVDRRPVAEFTLATNEPARITPAGHEVPPRTEWHRIVMTDQAAEFAENYIRKGSKMLIEGTLRTRTWEDRNTIKRTVTEVYVEKFELFR